MAWFTVEAAMKPKREPIWLALVTAIFLSASLLDVSAQPGSPPILTLPNGAQLVFAGTTYGTINTPPSPEKYIGQHNIQFNEGETFETPQFFVWFQWKETNAPLGRTMPQLIARLADQKGVERGAVSYPAFSDGVPLSYVEFPAIPRRSQILQLNFYPFFVGLTDLVTSVSFTNPLYGHFPEWKPEPVPAVKKTGDLEVRLVNLMTGIRQSGSVPVLANGKQGIGFQPAQGGIHLATFFDVLSSSTRGTNEEWVVQSAELSDATGNIIASPAYVGSSGPGVSPMVHIGEYRFSLPGALWPDEPAWRLKLELKRKSGFTPEEFVTFANVPVPKIGTTNFAPFTNIVGGVQIVLKEFLENGDRTNIRYPRGTNANYFVNDHTPETLVAVELPGHPEGVAVDFVKMVADTDEIFQEHGNTWRPFYRAASLRFIPSNVKTVDITWVVQKMRSMEFLVKPPLPD
jgi:hypothetical protein